MKMKTKFIVGALALAFAGMANASFTVEQDAYIKAIINGERAACLVRVVDDKLDGDVIAGEIRDFGNVLEATSICETYSQFMARYNAVDAETKANFEKNAKKYLKDKFNA